MNKIVSNDTIILEPQIPIFNNAMEFDFPSLKIGVAEYKEGPTGCTVFHFPNEAIGAVDIRGGSPSTFTTDNHNLIAGERLLDAICFTGGSVHGLEAVTGVTAELLKIHNYSTSWMPKVVGATIYDFVPRGNAIYPDKALGRAAFQNTKENQFPSGSCGAGRSATVGKGFRQWEYGGQGASFRQIGETKIAVFTVVNSLGGIMNRKGEIVRGYYDKEKDARYLDLEKIIGDKNIGNTTLSLVVTNQKLPSGALRQLSKQIHTSMARAIYPFHTLFDGDVLFMVTTNEVQNEKLDTNTLGLISSEIAWDAVLNSVSYNR
ncbi:MAG: P1 family peptidase [Bacillota bacterium]